MLSRRFGSSFFCACVLLDFCFLGDFFVFFALAFTASGEEVRSSVSIRDFFNLGTASYLGVSMLRDRDREMDVFADGLGVTVSLPRPPLMTNSSILELDAPSNAPER